MKIVYCIYDISEGGGVGRVLTTKVNYLVANGYDITIVSLNNTDKNPYYSLDPRVKIVPFKLKYEGLVYHKPLWQRFFYAIYDMLSYRCQMKEFIEKNNPDIIVTTHRLPTFLFPTLNHAIKIQELHSSFYMYKRLRPNKMFSLRTLLHKFYELRDRFFISFFDASSCLTKKDWILRGRHKQMQVIYNPTHFNSNHTSKLDIKNVLFIGRLSEEKDIKSLLDIWSNVIGQVPDWHLNIVGDGPLRTELEEHILNLGLTSSVSLLGEQKDIEGYYLNSSIYVMTSRFEGLPTVLIEAQYFGIPCISYDCPCGPSDIITDGKDGFLVAPNDKDTFAQRLIQLMQDKDLRKQMGLNAKRASERFDVDTIMPQWENLFTKLMKEKNGK